ncbi:heme A synthase [Pseudoalteromonas sp. MEBiC 03607]|jgi:cytochrome c oxidase assembly protein subunit 15|uniref:COX15/CtaA family protein n=1 Tax=Pseudoalteromonas TaxID=53246 RepID=UPI000C6AC44F|nr:MULTISPECIES: COX15/CtaA family protein [unclassified Pseudoalteromonas]MBU77155.1 cytochrome B [Pseudoalteromonadaceae bacterium]HCV03147.1 cytochrome B [Pseudoalteromonas sp.]MCF2900489.1 COX15/CtaA family protein [Pseudoalteromonas sp. OFAV1]MCF2920096.1 COX15/CtaA family protein [Pseudoalteromonas sp. APAL1]MCO7251040.1 COX15/CtaA family protein [Pseudoalteromonas sp. Ps84H-4]|tara:strand:- start:302 stop:1291 length:990 start_codon:yes stop_codon:yes gene_type:complete
MYKNYKYLVLITVFFSILVVGLGAYTRLSDAGLGCPDWPGCYGFLTVPKHETALLHVEQNYPDMMFEAAKAWKEMIHRYFAGALGLLILALFVFAWLKRQYPNTPVKLPLALLLLVIFQAALGMWTVTMNLQPLVVMGHLLGGFSILSLLFLLYLRLTTKPIAGGDAGARPYYRLALVGLVVLVLQIALGGWLAANYAAPHCNGLPLCSYGQPFSLKSVFQLPLEHSTYEYGVLSQQARMSIHLLHRIWALVTCVVLALIMWRIYSQSFSRKIKHCTVTVLVALLCQICLGLAVVHWHFPLSVALAHNLMAALLLLSMVRLCFHLKART